MWVKGSGFAGGTPLSRHMRHLDPQESSSNILMVNHKTPEMERHLLTTANSSRSAVGSPLHSSGKLASLPREIRDEIYTLLLVSESSFKGWHDPTELRMYVDYNYPEYPLFDLRGFTIGLLYVSKHIALEAAAIFYGLNTFMFGGSQTTWNPLCYFLLQIGSTNRSHLRDLWAEISAPEPLLLYSDGTTTSNTPSFLDRVILKPDEYPRKYSEPIGKDGTVIIAELPAAIKTIFRLLSCDGPDLRLNLSIYEDSETFLPDLPYDHSMHTSQWPMELPKHVDRMRKKYSTGNSRVEITWHASLSEEGEEHLEAAKFFIEKAGWEILELKINPYGSPSRDLAMCLRENTD